MKEEATTTSFAESILGKSFFEDSITRRFLALSPTLRLALVAGGFAALVLVPFLGAVGLWDCWEPHYGEIARSMLHRGDWVYPYWENGWLFSKPVFTFWLMALGMSVVDTNGDGTGALATYTEWGFRMPFVVMSIMAVVLLSLAVSRTVSRRAGFATAFVLVTMPMYFLISRQAITDTPFVASFVCAMACALIGQLDESTKRRAAWWYASYIFMAVGVLAKGLPALLYSAAILLIYALLCVIPWDSKSWKKHGDWIAKYALVPLAVWVGVAVVAAGISYTLMKGAYSGDVPDQLLVRKIFAGIIGFVVGLAAFVFTLHKRVPAELDEMPVLWAQFYRMRLGSGVVVFFAVALGWYLTLSLFEEVGNSEEGQLFWMRFFVHDHFNRMFAGVHTTTPGGTFTYFIEQGGFGLFPWVALVPGAISLASRLKIRGGTTADHTGIIAAIWVVFTFTFLASSSTKFHHYVFPVLPGVAILIAMFIDKLWKDGLAKHALALVFGLGLLVLISKDLASNPKNFTDLFVYNYDRPYPFDLVTKPLQLFGSRQLWWGDLAAVMLLAFGGYLTLDAFMDKARPVMTRAMGLGMLLTGVALLLTVWLRGRGSPSLLLGLGIAFTAVYLGYEASRHKKDEASSLWTTAAVVGLVGVALIVNGVRVPATADALLPRIIQTVNLKQALGFVFGVAILLMVVAAALRAKTMLFGTFFAFALAFTLWFNWSHWVDLTHHWTQRDLFGKYHKEKKPDEPIAAFWMNWRGETFYSRNQVKQFNPKNAAEFQNYVNLPGRKWVLVEHSRLDPPPGRDISLKRTVGPNHEVRVWTTPESNNKFVLVSID